MNSRREFLKLSTALLSGAFLPINETPKIPDSLRIIASEVPGQTVLLSPVYAFATEYAGTWKFIDLQIMEKPETPDI